MNATFDGVSPELVELERRILRSIHHGPPDCLSTPGGETFRAQFARIFAMGVGHAWQQPARGYADLPVPLFALTDPYLFRVPGGALILDHPQSLGENEWLVGQARRVTIYDAPEQWTLHANRRPRVLIISDGRRFLHSTDLFRVLHRDDFHGPFLRRGGVRLDPSAHA